MGAADARPVDWGPHISTGRVADLSPGLAAALGLRTDDVVRITISALRAIPVKPAKGTKRPTPVSRTAPPGKPVIKQFIRSPNCSSRNVGTKIDKIVLHCTEGSLASALAEFQRGDSRKVSAHYVIDRNGDIYQMVNDADCANHCMGANAGSIGIEHVGSETDALAAPQAAASAALIRWLLQEHQIPRTNIFGHDFTPGYSVLEGPVVRTSSSARCTHKPRSLLGSRLTCELTSRPELSAPAQAFFLCQARCVELVYLVRVHSTS